MLIVGICLLTVATAFLALCIWAGGQPLCQWFHSVLDLLDPLILGATQPPLLPCRMAGFNAPRLSWQWQAALKFVFNHFRPDVAPWTQVNVNFLPSKSAKDPPKTTQNRRASGVGPRWSPRWGFYPNGGSLCFSVLEGAGAIFLVLQGSKFLTQPTPN